MNRPLEGVPIAVKDNIDVVGDGPTTGGTSGLLGHIPRFEGTLWSWKMRQFGAICAGKTNMSELGLGTTTKNQFYGPAKSCFDLERTAGGSSGGSGGAVGSGIVPVSLASDTTGGIRIPAACNASVGFRPTINRWPCDFGLKLAPTFDSIGAITVSVTDAKLLDSLVTEEKPLSFEGSRSSIRIGIPSKHFYDDLDPSIEQVV